MWVPRHFVGRVASRAACAVALCVALLPAFGAAAESDSCREWLREHRDWKTEVVRRYLKGASQRELDEAIFELLQRETYLTACDVSVQRGRGELVAWRLVDRLPDEYGSAVLESLLAQGGFQLDLRGLFEGSPPLADASERGERSARSARSRHLRGR